MSYLVLWATRRERSHRIPTPRRSRRKRLKSFRRSITTPQSMLAALSSPWCALSMRPRPYCTLPPLLIDDDFLSYDSIISWQLLDKTGLSHCITNKCIEIKTSPSFPSEDEQDRCKWWIPYFISWFNQSIIYIYYRYREHEDHMECSTSRRDRAICNQNETNGRWFRGVACDGYEYPSKDIHPGR